MAIDQRREIAAAELRRFVTEEASDFLAVDLLWQALSARGKVLGGGAGFAWGLVPLLICEELGVNPDQAMLLSAAAECFIAAADVFDDLQDADTEEALWHSCGAATASNVATLLLFLSQRAVCRLAERGLPGHKVAQVMQVFAGAGIKACNGQQHDLNRTDSPALDESGYLGVVAQKAGALAEGVCQAAALVASDDPAHAETYGRFGRDLGAAMQIGNDVAAMSVEGRDRSDLRTGKPTLPLIFALQTAPAETREAITDAVRRAQNYELSTAESDRLRDLVASTGALYYAVAVAGVYWERALVRVADGPLRAPVMDMSGGLEPTGADSIRG